MLPLSARLAQQLALPLHQKWTRLLHVTTDSSASASAAPGAIVVLGARIEPSGAATPALRRRVEHAVKLHREGAAPLILFSGGHTGGPTSEARAAVQLALDAGLLAEQCMLEETSRSTRQNAQNCAALLKVRGIHIVVLVTDATHMPRARMLFTRAGLHVISAEVMDSAFLSAGARALRQVRELLARVKDWALPLSNGR